MIVEEDDIFFNVGVNVQLKKSKFGIWVVYFDVGFDFYSIGV